MGLALGALAGVLSGLGGVPAGMQAGTQANQAQQHIDLMQQHLAQQQEANYADVPGQMLPSGMQGQVDPTKGTTRIRSTLLGPILAAGEKETARNEAVKRSAALALSLKSFSDPTSPDYHPAYKDLQDALQSGADATQVAPMFEKIQNDVLNRRQQQQQMRAMAAFMTRGMDPAAAAALRAEMGIQDQPAPRAPGAVPAGAIYQQTGGAEAPLPLTGSIPPGPPPPGQNPLLQGPGAQLGGSLDAMADARRGMPGVPPGPAPVSAPPPQSPYAAPAFDFGPKGINMKMNPLPPSQPGTELVAAMKEKQALQAAGVPETDPRYKPINDRLDLYKAWVLPPGGAELKGAGSGMDRPGPGPTAQMVPGRPMATTPPPVSTDAETKTASGALDWIKQARDRATQLEDYLSKLTPQQRASFAGRTTLQGNKLASWIPGLTSKEEQDITSAIGNLLVKFESAAGGMRAVSNVGIQERMRQIVADPTSSAGPQHLRTIAAMMEEELKQRAAAEAKGGRRPISAPPATPGPGAPPTPQGETLSRRDPRYQQARQRGMTDQMIQSKYGITLTD